MRKKFTITMIALGLTAIVGFTGFGIWRSTSKAPSFDTSGYILQGESEGVKQLSFLSGENYASTLSGAVSFTSTESGKTVVPRESFVHFDDNSMMALSDGILLDFNDLSENFINNYFINAGLRISEAGGSYTAETTAGSMKFGEHIWKLSDQKYMVEAPTLKVHLAEGDVREVNSYIQVLVTEDQIVHLLTPENLWMTISEDCYIETAGGVKIFPVSQLIDDGAYKLSLAKLSVSTEDAIVLTEDETRRQIVPELNIEAIDGEDGEDGEDGQIGEDGEAGEVGTDGDDGENGQTGADGEKGNSGSTGSKGSSGKDGSAGASGADGSGGKNGGNGSAGKDAVTESSTNSALPSMAITDWQVSATELKGTISVTDVGGFLTAVGELGERSRYPGSVKIINTSTGEVIECYETSTHDYVIVEGSDPTFNFYNGAEEIYFSTNGQPLEPDTEYRLSVTAYYKTTDQTNMIYSREFISRVFYTDSTGVHLSYEEATQDSVTISAAVSADYVGSLEKATVYLLTPEQNRSFSSASAADSNSYTASQELAFSNDNITEVVFAEPALAPNTKYIARVLVETNSGLKTLTRQELQVMTLKRTPTTATGSVPSANYNRVTGAFEIYRPVVEDLDGGAVSYTYTAYRLDGSTWVKESSRTIDSSAGEPVEFRLQSGETYRFGVELAFHDNEKLVYYDLGQSDAIKSEGDSMPKITLTPESSGVEYNKFSGQLRIALGEKSNITVDENHPLHLEFYADQIQNEAVELKNGTPVSVENRYTITLNENTQNSNYLDITLLLDNLYKNTNYSITVSGYLDVGDGNGGVNRAIGTVSFRTYNTLTLNAVWNRQTSESGASISRTLALSVQDSQATDIRKNYAESELKVGQVTVELFSGTGTGKLRIAQKNFNDTEALNAIFGSGLTITEDDFGSPPLNPSGNYTLTVSAVTDESYGLDLGYVNSFDNILNASEVVSAEPTPPDLLLDPSQGVKATPIYNKDAVTYGGRVDDDLPDDAIVGYTLESSYDNVQRIGKSITYYAFEYNTFFNALAQNDPLMIADPLMEMTLPIDSGSDSVPKVAVLFGGVKSETATHHGGYEVYYAGEPNQQGSLISGMGRGYRYIFAYTVEYAGSSTGEGETTRTYPYDHKEYLDYNRLHGGVRENGVQIGNGVAYILNSGMCETPVIMPDFHTYVYSSTPDDLSGPNATTASGKVLLHYRWRDPDNLIVTDGTDNNTKIAYKWENDTVETKIQENSVSGSEWYQIELKYTIAKGSPLLIVPSVNISEYKLDYDTVLNRFGMADDVRDYPIGSVPVEWSWEKQFNSQGYTDILLTLDINNLAENYIAFRFNNEDTRSKDLVSRAVAMQLTFQLTGGANEKTFLLPLVSDVTGTYAKLATGLLGTEYLGKDFTVTNAVLLYDTGEQGWGILEQPSSDGFALQYTNRSDALDQFEFSNYIGVSGASGPPANGALLSFTGNSFSVSALQDTIKTETDADSKLPLTTQNKITQSYSTRYLYPARMGVDAHNSLSVAQLSGQYLVPKKVGSYTLCFSAGHNTGNLSTMTPTIDRPGFGVSSTAIAIQQIKVSGFADGGTIYAAAYKTREDAEGLVGDQAAALEIPISVDGRPVQDSNTTLDGLNGETKYYLAFYYKDNAGKNVLLLTSDTAQPAIYELVTSSKAAINIKELEYRNNSYFDKSLVVDFTISRLFNINLSYDIYASEADANSSAATPILSHEEMDTDNENDILNAPTNLEYENVVSINLKPGAAREKLKPGVTYWLKISATEEGGTDAGSVVQPFTITAIGNYDALIYVSSAGKDSITFQVTINDPQYSLMGRDMGAGSSTEGALYAVRFTDENGNVLRTTYDNEVYSASELKKEFILCDDNLLQDNINLNNQIIEDTTYQIHIYAVPDDDHNGTIQLAGEDQPRGWLDFFDKTVAALKDCGAKFLEIIKSFWATDTSPIEDAREAQLRIATKSQQTTPEDGWILNENGVFPSRGGPTTVRVLFEESIGLIGDEPVFKQIDWSVNGKMSDGTPVSASGQSLYSQGDGLLVADTDAGGYNRYHFDIPYELGQGSYTIVLQFRTTEGAGAPSRTITIRSGV